jgi:hypothetical protein
MPEPIVIATTSRTRMIGGILVVLACVLPVFYFWYLALSDWDHSFSSSPFRQWGLLTMTLIYLGASPLFIKGFRQIIRHDGRVVWIEKDQLNYYHPSHFSVPCQDIVALLPVAGYMGHDSIAVVTRDGGRKKFIAVGMNISRDEILKRLCDVCGLPEPAPADPEQA